MVLTRESPRNRTSKKCEYDLEQGAIGLILSPGYIQRESIPAILVTVTAKGNIPGFSNREVEACITHSEGPGGQDLAHVDSK
jgi:hypothetical protein